MKLQGPDFSDFRDPIFSDSRNPMIIVSDSRDPIWNSRDANRVPKTPKKNLLTRLICKLEYNTNTHIPKQNTKMKAIRIELLQPLG